MSPFVDSRPSLAAFQLVRLVQVAVGRDRLAGKNEKGGVWQ